MTPTQSSPTTSHAPTVAFHLRQGSSPFQEIYFPRLSRAYTASPYIVGFDLYNKGRSRERIRLNHVARTSSPLLAATSQCPLEPGSCCPLVIVSSTRSTAGFVSRARAVRHASEGIDCLWKAMAPPPRFLNSILSGPGGMDGWVRQFGPAASILMSNAAITTSEDDDI